MSLNFSTSRKIPQYGKLDFEECVKNFRLLVLNNITDINRIKLELITSGKLSHCDKTYIRAFSWKIFLNVLSTKEKSSLKSWIDETNNQRKNVKKMFRSNTINKLKGDPLGGIESEKEKSSEWNAFLIQSETIKMIKYDVDRTMPGEKLFQEPFIRDMETTILTNFAKNHKSISYRQGMNEILSLIIYALFPYYGKSPNNKYTTELYEKWLENPVENAQDIYFFFHDENEFECDIYTLFENLMIKLGLGKFFEDESKTSKSTAYFIKRIKDIISKKLSVLDRAIFSHFQNQNLDYAMVFQRCCKCLFKREFPLPDTCLIWDYIFAHEAEKPSGTLLYVDYIILAMITNVKYNLLSRDSNGMFQVFLNYPKISPITNLLNMADKIAENITITPTEQLIKPEPEKKEDKKEEKKPEEINQAQTQTQNTNNIINNPLGQINPLLFNPNLMMNPNLQNNPVGNMMLAMMMQQAATQNQQVVNNTTNNSGESSTLSILNELKELTNKYKSMISVGDKNRMDFLIDSLAKKL